MIRANRGRIPGILYLVIPVVFLSLQSVWAQDRPAQTNSRSSPKNWQLKFSVGPNLMLNQFDGFKIYLQRGLAGGKALRVGAGLQNYDEDRKYEYQYTNPLNDYLGRTKRDLNQSMVSMAFDFLRYLKNPTSIMPYLGIGPFIDYSFRKIDQLSRIDEPPDVTIYEERVKILDAGIRTILGAEWHLKGPLFLHAEYNLRFLYEKNTITYTLKNPGNNPEYVGIISASDNGYRIEPDNIKAGLSIAF